MKCLEERDVQAVRRKAQEAVVLVGADTASGHGGQRREDSVAGRPGQPPIVPVEISHGSSVRADCVLSRTEPGRICRHKVGRAARERCDDDLVVLGLISNCRGAHKLRRERRRVDRAQILRVGRVLDVAHDDRRIADYGADDEVVTRGHGRGAVHQRCGAGRSACAR